MSENMYDAWDNGDRHEIRQQFARREEITRMAREAGFEIDCCSLEWHNRIERFAALVAAAKDAEHKEAMRWDIHSCGPTCKRYACVATREAVAAEREACAKVCEEKQEYSMPIACPDGISGCLVAHYVPARRDKTGSECAAAIRARGQA